MVNKWGSKSLILIVVIPAEAGIQERRSPIKTFGNDENEIAINFRCVTQT